MNEVIEENGNMVKSEMNFKEEDKHEEFDIEEKLMEPGETFPFATYDIPPNQTLYIKNLEEKIKQEGLVNI
jgi:hypothetical protein